MRRNLNRALTGTCLTLACAWTTTAWATSAPILEICGPSLTVYKPTSKTPVQDLRPRFDQRGVDIDGTLKAVAPLGWAINGDPLGGGYAGGRTLGDVNLCTGAYNPTDIDLALPTLGLPVVIGRTYNCLQEDSTPARFDSGGYQGYNWAQAVQPELRPYSPGGSSNMMYLVYGADRYIEFKSAEGWYFGNYKAVNGAAGVIVYTFNDDSADYYTYYDQRGNQMVFFGFNGFCSPCQGQLWKMIDPAGNVAYAGNSSSASSAISGGFDGSGRVTLMYDASGRRYEFSYASFGGQSRLQTVLAKENISGSWPTVAQVDYDYYTSTTTTNDIGLAGDLKTAKVTMKGTGTYDYVRTKYYRYYTRALVDSTGRRGNAHQLRMVVGFDGVRQYGSGYDSDADSLLMPYADMYFEYQTSSDYRIKAVTFNGNCGCSGGSSGMFTLSYDPASGYGTAIGSGAYDNAWEQRTIIYQPDGNYVTQYFDETGAVFSRVITNAIPTGSPTKTWVTGVERNSNGQVEKIHSPANLNTYSYGGGSPGSMTYKNSGLITVYNRHASSDNLDGLRDNVQVKDGTGSGSGTAVTVSSIAMSDRQLLPGVSAISIPQVDSTSTYPVVGTATTTSYGYDYWEASDNTSPLYLAPKTITTTNPMVPASSPNHHGSGSATVTYRFLRKDGSTALTEDAGAILFYSGRTAFGQTAIQVADVDISHQTDDFTAEDLNSGSNWWGISTSGSGPIRAITTMTYDHQGRPTTTTQPSYGTSGSTTRLSARTYTVPSSGGELVIRSYPRYSSTPTYYGPVGYTIVNHAGRTVRSAVISVSGSGTSSEPGDTPGSDWSAIVDTQYDQTGMRATEIWTYTIDASTKDKAYLYYDAMGRRDRSIDATTTLTRTKFDERGMPIERWVGTNDNGWSASGGASPGATSGTNDMVQVDGLIYDGGSDGKNGLLTTRTQHGDGDWGGSTDVRTTTHAYDYRGRMCVQVNPVEPHTLLAYDNSNRVVAAATFKNGGTTPSAGDDPTKTTWAQRVGLSETFYDERGQVYQSKRWEINQSTGNTADSMLTDNWYDADGRLVKTYGQQITKTYHDRLGRPFARFVLANDTDGTTYSNVLTVNSADTVLEESYTGLDPTTGRPLVRYSIQRHHDDPIAASSGTPGDMDAHPTAHDYTTIDPGDVTGRVQIAAMWYDDWERVIDTVNFGNNGGGAFDYYGDYGPSSPPSRDDTHLRATTTYDGFGRVWKMLDPAAVENWTEYDFGGRRSKTTDNYDDGTAGGGGNNDKDRVVEYAYGAGGLVSSVTREMPSSGDDQTTTYTYGTTLSGCQIATGHLLSLVTCPEQTPGQTTHRSVAYTYNALSQVLTTTDPEGNIITNTYDTGGRVSARVITTYAPSGIFNTRVKEIDTSYNTRGMVSDVLQKNSSGTTLDEVAFDHDGWGALKEFTQDPDSAIGSSGRSAYSMTWDYAQNTTTDGWRKLQLNSWGQPGASGHDDYTLSSSTGIDAATARVSSVVDPNNTTIADYAYLGVCTVVGVDYPEAAVFSHAWGWRSVSLLPGAPTRTDYAAAPAMGARLLTATDAAGGGRLSDPYTAFFDNFGRPIGQQWVKDLGGTPLDPVYVSLTMTYDRVGNALTVQDDILHDANSTPNRNFDYKSSYDDLRRLVSRQEGKLSSGSISPQSRIENSGRNLAGRITSDQVSLNNDGDYTDGPPNAPDAGEMDDTRTYNKRNELRGRSYYDHAHSGSPASVTLSYDYNGNLIDDGEKYSYVYNPWGQLVEIDNRSGGKPQAFYTYNGLGQRISEQLDTSDSSNTGNGDGAVDTHDPVVYMALDASGRRVASFRGTDDCPKETFVYPPGGFCGPCWVSSDPILCDRNKSLADPTKWATETAGSTRADRRYYCADTRGNTVALLGMGKYSAVMLEQYRYSPSGVPYGIPLGDVDADGTVTGTTSGADYLIVKGLSDVSGYENRADLNLDGVVDSADIAICAAGNTNATGRGKLSVAGVGNRAGPAGCESLGQLAMLLVPMNSRFYLSHIELSLLSDYPTSSAIARAADAAGTTAVGCWQPPGFPPPPFPSAIWCPPGACELACSQAPPWATHLTMCAIGVDKCICRCNPQVDPEIEDCAIAHELCHVYDNNLQCQGTGPGGTGTCAVDNMNCREALCHETSLQCLRDKLTSCAAKGNYACVLEAQLLILEEQATIAHLKDCCRYQQAGQWLGTGPPPTECLGRGRCPPIPAPSAPHGP